MLSCRQRSGPGRWGLFFHQGWQWALRLCCSTGKIGGRLDRSRHLVKQVNYRKAFFRAKVLLTEVPMFDNKNCSWEMLEELYCMAFCMWEHTLGVLCQSVRYCQTRRSSSDNNEIILLVCCLRGRQDISVDEQSWVCRYSWRKCSKDGEEDCC